MFLKTGSSMLHSKERIGIGWGGGLYSVRLGGNSQLVTVLGDPVL